MATPSIIDYTKEESTFDTDLFADVANTLDSGSGVGDHDGKLLLIIGACDIDHTYAIDDGDYSQLFEEQNASDCTLVCYYKLGVDSEVNPTLSITAGTEAMLVYAFAIDDWDGNTPLYAVAQSGGATDMVCPTVTATAEALVIRVSIHRNSTITYSTIPETTIEQGNTGSESSTGVQIGLAQTTKNNEATGTATFVTDFAADNVKATIVIQGASSGGVPKVTKTMLLGVG